MQRRATDRGHRLAQGIGGLAGAYWRSGERWSAAFFSIVIVIVSLAMVGINLMQNIATGSVFTALQENNARGFYLGLGGLMAAIVSYMFAAVAQLYLRQTFQLRWRRWLTDHYLKDWLARHVFYRMRFRDGIDNPDQRISDPRLHGLGGDPLCGARLGLRPSDRAAAYSAEQSAARQGSGFSFQSGAAARGSGRHHSVRRRRAGA
jgi:hypothetical protein